MSLFIAVMVIVMIQQDEASRYTTPDSSDEHDPSNVEDTRMCAWRIFFEASTHLQGVLENRLKRQFGLTLSDYNVLLALWKPPHHTLRIGELAQRVIFSPSRLTYTATHLERDGWIEKTSAKEDRRSSCACLTSQGEEVVKKANALHQGMIREYLLESFNEEEICDIVRIIQELGDKFSKIRAWVHSFAAKDEFGQIRWKTLLGASVMDPGLVFEGEIVLKSSLSGARETSLRTRSHLRGWQSRQMR